MKKKMWWPKSSLYFLFVLSCVGLAPDDLEGDYSKCKETDLVVYNLIFETHWTRKNFPKQYPENRPPAHWSKLIGRTHDENYILFRIGEVADKDFKLFAETGKTEASGKQMKYRHVFDEFSSSSIKTGAGRTQVNFFVDGNHSMVSLAVRIIPSPDWFVGVDSLALCTEGTWLDSITIEASPIDAGTDSGFTFTAPNWETEPQERITKITSKYPKHPANSFYYPKLRDLPVIATFHIVKKKFYQLTRRVQIRESHPEAFRNQSIRVNNRNQERGKTSKTSDNDLNSSTDQRVNLKRYYKKRKFKNGGLRLVKKSEEEES